jgi:hypothetical protein
MDVAPDRMSAASIPAPARAGDSGTGLTGGANANPFGLWLLTSL